ncbi:hypothetical protein SLS53_009141 [Cytospora paraplurivora]|uniref:Cenp-O kinetochore centromere component n=1 Tax=Cytospora paraplurivora TaxID=2898453 RepID=A0AAN9TWG0_9PEZI
MPSESELDDEIASLKARAIAAAAAPDRDALQARLEKQQAYDQQCLYRTCAGVTTFRVRDPDPNAVDGGNVLGVRIEVMTRAKFIRPYYVFLVRPYSPPSEGGGGSGGSEQGRRFLRVHRHTVPPGIPIGGLAARYLPAPRARTAATDEVGDGDGRTTKKERTQDLSRFVRCLRREIIRYHNRVAIIADLRRSLGLDGRKRDAGELAGRSSILAISAADAEAKQVRVDWKDGRSGRIVINDDGDVDKVVVFGDQGRDRETEREALSRGSRLELVARKLAEM